MPSSSPSSTREIERASARRSPARTPVTSSSCLQPRLALPAPPGRELVVRPAAASHLGLPLRRRPALGVAWREHGDLGRSPLELALARLVDLLHQPPDTLEPARGARGRAGL